MPRMSSVISCHRTGSADLVFTDRRGRQVIVEAKASRQSKAETLQVGETFLPLLRRPVDGVPTQSEAFTRTYARLPIPRAANAYCVKASREFGDMFRPGELLVFLSRPEQKWQPHEVHERVAAARLSHEDCLRLWFLRVVKDEADSDQEVEMTAVSGDRKTKRVAWNKLNISGLLLMTFQTEFSQDDWMAGGPHRQRRSRGPGSNNVR